MEVDVREDAPPPSPSPSGPTKPAHVFSAAAGAESTEDFVPVDSENEDDDIDSAFYSVQSATISLSSSIHSYIHENGRSYHAYQSGKYAFPNDRAECDRLDYYHHIFLLWLDGALHRAPIKDPKRILDLGTGTGVWAVDAAEQYPGAEVIGNDLSPIQPRFTWPNLRFEVDDVELEWAWPADHFSFIHLRCMSASIGSWPHILRQALHCTEPGGYFEFQDWCGRLMCDDTTMPTDSALARWFTLMQQATEAAGRPLIIAEYLKDMMEEAGWVEVEVRMWKWPYGAWPREKKLKEIGKWTLHGALDGLCALSMRVFTRQFGWQREEVEELSEQCAKELKFGIDGKKVHFYSRACFIFGRKPFPTEVATKRSREKEETIATQEMEAPANEDPSTPDSGTAEAAPLHSMSTTVPANPMGAPNAWPAHEMQLDVDMDDDHNCASSSLGTVQSQKEERGCDTASMDTTDSRSDCRKNLWTKRWR